MTDERSKDGGTGGTPDRSSAEERKRPRAGRRVRRVRRGGGFKKEGEGSGEAGRGGGSSSGGLTDQPIGKVRGPEAGEDPSPRRADRDRERSGERDRPRRDRRRETGEDRAERPASESPGNGGEGRDARRDRREGRGDERREASGDEGRDARREAPRESRREPVREDRGEPRRESAGEGSGRGGTSDDASSGEDRGDRGSERRRRSRRGGRSGRRGGRRREAREDSGETGGNAGDERRPESATAEAAEADRDREPRERREARGARDTRDKDERDAAAGGDRPAREGRDRGRSDGERGDREGRRRSRRRPRDRDRSARGGEERQDRQDRQDRRGSSEGARGGRSGGSARGGRSGRRGGDQGRDSGRGRGGSSGRERGGRDGGGDRSARGGRGGRGNGQGGRGRGRPREQEQPLKPTAALMLPPQPVKVMIAGGGTGGHIIPALAIGEAIKQRNPESELFYLGSDRGIEQDLIGGAGYRLEEFALHGLPMRPSLKSFKAAWATFQAYRRIRRLIREFEPDVMVGTGGHVTVPAIYAAHRAKVPVVIQEQNTVPGRANRLLAKYAAEIHIHFAESRRYFKQRGKLRLSGNPVRVKIPEGRALRTLHRFRLYPDRKTVLILGGSQGAHSLNEAFREMLPFFRGDRSVQFLIQTGTADHAAVLESVRNSGVRVVVRGFFKRMEEIYGVAHLVVARAGAMTIAEISALGLPSLLIPYPHATDDHQMINARALADKDAAAVLPDRELSGERLAEEIRTLLDDGKRLRTMARNAYALSRPEAARRIAEAVESLGGGAPQSQLHLPEDYDAEAEDAVAEKEA